MAYPSIISQPGSAARNLSPVIEAITPLVEEDYGAARDSPRRILELASFPYEHIRGFAQRWPQTEWWGTVRDVHELSAVAERKPDLNLHAPHVLDITVDTHWEDLRNTVGDVPFSGIVMLNLIHCCPEGVPESIFQNLSPRTEKGRKLLDPLKGWIAAYGAFLNDDGTYRSANDAEFDRTHIRGQHESLGLRTPTSITAMAKRWGFVEAQRCELARGNLLIVWRVVVTE